jgi:hypothetical protein
MKANRIQELATQAGYKDLPTVRLAFYGFDKEKFAKLIVKECLNKIYLEAAQYAEPVWAFELVNDIKEHFGVTK